MNNSPKLSEIKKQVIDQLKETKCVKFGEFKLKSGITSPVYVDLRCITMHHSLFNSVVELIKSVISNYKQYDDWDSASRASPPVAIVGVPYGVVPIASAVAFTSKLLYYPIRKETKDYGVKPDTNSHTDHEFIIIEDVVSTGSSIIETIEKLEGKKVTDIIVIVDRQLGGIDKMRALYPQIRIHSIITIEEILKSN